MTLTVLPLDTTTQVVVSGNPSDTGVVTTTLTNQNGCDSVVIVTTVLTGTDTTYITDGSCNPSDTGVVTTVITNQYGADSVILITTTTLWSSQSTTISDTICAGETYTVGGVGG